MKYEVKYACGHIGIVDIVGKSADRERKLAWLETCDCPVCYKAQMDAMIAEQEKAENLPELEGSEKQVAWAKKIRIELLNEVKDFMQDFKQDEHTKAFTEWVKGQKSAKFWIDNRTACAQQIAWLWKNEITK